MPLRPIPDPFDAATAEPPGLYRPAAYDPTLHHPDPIDYWTRVAARQAAKDAVLLPRLARFLRPGRVLELGAGVGQVSRHLSALGFDVVASEYAPFFVAHLQAQGLVAQRVDALRIAEAGLGSFDSIFSQSISPFITVDVDVIRQAYRSSFEALVPGGRFMMIHAMAGRAALAATMRQHADIARATGFSDIRVVRNQLLPSAAYRAPLAGIAALAERLFGARWGVRFVLTATRPDA